MRNVISTRDSIRNVPTKERGLPCLFRCRYLTTTLSERYSGSRDNFFVNISKQTCKFIFSSAFVISCITEFQNFKTHTPGPDLIQMVSKSFYCSAVLSSISKKNLTKLQLVQNNACRIVAGLMFQKPSSP